MQTPSKGKISLTVHKNGLWQHHSQEILPDLDSFQSFHCFVSSLCLSLKDKNFILSHEEHLWNFLSSLDCWHHHKEVYKHFLFHSDKNNSLSNGILVPAWEVSFNTMNICFDIYFMICSHMGYLLLEAILGIKERQKSLACWVLLDSGYLHGIAGRWYWKTACLGLNSTGRDMHCLGGNIGQLGSTRINIHRTRRLFLYIMKKRKSLKVGLR